MAFASGFVSIMGRPNVGKSTLLNQIIQQKVAITTPKAQTTRSNIRGVYHSDDTEIVFVDTPGIHKPKELLGREMIREAWAALDGVDAVYLLIDAQKGFGEKDREILDRLEKSEIPVILVVNKVDAIQKSGLLELLQKVPQERFAEIVPVSARNGKNIEELIKATRPYLPNNEPIYDEDVYTLSSEKFMIAELVREQLMKLTEMEVPHSLAVLIEKMEFKKNSVTIYGLILVEKESQKGIVIGKNGSLLKEVGTRCRPEIEQLLGKKVFLQLFVRVESDWRNRQKLITELGYSDAGTEDE